MATFSESELILRPDGSIYHLGLHPEQIANIIITVGDPERVNRVSKYFDRIEHRVQKREFLTHTGWLGQQRLTVISTGIGTDNVDIVMNELDALVNIDLKNREPLSCFTQLDFIRIGTSGCLKKEIPMDSFLVSEMGISMDNLLTYYQLTPSMREEVLSTRLSFFLQEKTNLPVCFLSVIAGSEELMAVLGKELYKGVTLTCPGFYGPQGRQLRATNSVPDLLGFFHDFNQKNNGTSLPQITNFEMETAGIYGLASLLGHRAISFNALLANRETGKFSKTPKKTVEQLIQVVLERISEWGAASR